MRLQKYEGMIGSMIWNCTRVGYIGGEEYIGRSMKSENDSILEQGRVSESTFSVALASHILVCVWKGFLNKNMRDWMISVVFS